MIRFSRIRKFIWVNRLSGWVMNRFSMVRRIILLIVVSGMDISMSSVLCSDWKRFVRIMNSMISVMVRFINMVLFVCCRLLVLLL